MRHFKGLALSFALALMASSAAYSQGCYLDASVEQSEHVGKRTVESSLSDDIAEGVLTSNALIGTAPLLAPVVESAPVPTWSSVRPPLNAAITKTGRTKKKREAYALKIREDEFSSSLLAGSTFPIELEGALSSKESAANDKVIGHLTQDLKIGSLVVAEKGAIVEGTVSKVVPACGGLKSNKLNKRYRNANGGIEIKFSRMIGGSANYEIVAVPSKGSAVQKLNAMDQPMMVNGLGEVGVPYHANRYTVLAIAISGGSAAAGPFGAAGAPVISAFFGGLLPAYGLGRPARPGEKYVRLKGAAMGAIRGTPFGFLTSGVFVHGLEATLVSGDQITLRLNKDLSIPTHQAISSN